jgi:hypothetical protein
MTIKTFFFVLFLSGLLAFSVFATRRGFGITEASKEDPKSVREGTAQPGHGRSGRFWLFRSGK